MGRQSNWAFVSRAIREGQIITPEIRAELDARRRTEGAEKAQRAAEREARKAELAKRQPAIDARRNAFKALDDALLALAIGASLITGRYVATSQVGMLKQRLARDHGAWFTCKAIPGQGVRFERINPPHAELASTNPHADLL